MLPEIAALVEQSALAALSQARHFMYHSPAWFIFGALIAYHLLQLLLIPQSRKTFSPESPANIVVTGAAQGLGKLLVKQFARSHPRGAVNLIIVDIRDDLAPAMLKEVREAAGDAAFKGVHFMRANLADKASTETTFERILSEFGPVHVLVNNHARCQGKRVDEMSIEQFKLTMDINFHSYVHLTMLFLGQPALKEAAAAKKTPQGFHLVNVNSIAGHATCQRNSDYSASKFALTGFTDALRQELYRSGSPVSMTNFYPYYIDTGLFEGFKPALGWLIPTLKAEKVARRMH